MFRPGENCWRVETAARFAVLPENDAYFRAVASALHQARRSVLLLGWQFDPRTRLRPELHKRERGEEIGHLLRRLVRERPQLEVRLLIWRSPLPIAWSQGFYPQRSRMWFKTKPINFRLDRARPPGACHHQKVVVVDDALAFWGGGDIATDRWDSGRHLDEDEFRILPSGRPYPPRHEMMAVCTGPAAHALGDLARARWLAATGETIAPPDRAAPTPWPEGVEADLTDIPLAIARTEPAWRGAAGADECERLHLDAIASAQRLIYLENQYVTSPRIAAALVERLQAPDGPEVVIVSTARSPSWFDQLTMDRAREVLLQRLREADRFGRLSAWAPYTEGGERIVVHSKLTIIDDRLLRLGSANLNNRSGGFDTELDVALEAKGPREPAAQLIRQLRARQIGHFLGVSEEAFHRADCQTSRLAETITALNTVGRLRPLGVAAPDGFARFVARFQLGDPASPADSWRPWKRRGLSHELETIAETEPLLEPQARPRAGTQASSKSTISGR